MAVDDGRLKKINASVTRDAHAGWRSFAAAHGVTVASFLEAVGRTMLEEPERVARSALTREMVAKARVIAEERGSRMPD